MECASFVAGPTGGMTLAQLGASVIRIDPLGGGADHHRWPIVGVGSGPDDAESYYWASLNKGKRSVTVDLRSDEGRELVTGLITACGVLVDNVVGRRWMTNDALVAKPPQPDPRARAGLPGRAARRGLHRQTPRSGSRRSPAARTAPPPVDHVSPACDLVAGLSVSTAVLAALYDRDRTGRGAYVELALADVALARVANLGWLSEAAERGHDRPRHRNHVYGSFGWTSPARTGSG